MRFSERSKKGYALITTVAVLAVIMALCSMLVAYSLYGKALSQSSEARYNEKRGLSETGNTFVSYAEIYGDELLNAYRTQGYHDGDEPYSVEKTENGITTIISRSVSAVTEKFSVTFKTHTKTETISLWRGEKPTEWAKRYEDSYVDENGVRQYFAGWTSIVNGAEISFASAEELPATADNITYTAVYGSGPEYVLTVIGEDEPREISYHVGQTLESVLSGSMKYYTVFEREAYGAPSAQTLRADDAESLLEAIEVCETGGMITYAGESLSDEDYITVKNSVKIISEIPLPLRAGEGYELSASYNEDGTRVYSFNGIARVFTRSAGASQITEYRGAIGEIANLVKEISSNNCYANENCTEHGIDVMGDIVLTGDVELTLPVIIKDDISISLSGFKITSAETAFQVNKGAALTVIGGSIESREADAAAVRGGSLTLTDVIVAGGISASDGSEIAVYGGSLTGDLSAWGSGNVTVSGSAENQFVIDGTVSIADKVRAELAYCRFVSENCRFSCLSSVPAILTACDFSTAKTGSFYERTYATGAQSAGGNVRTEKFYRVVAPEETLCGNLTLFEMPASTSIITYFGADGVPFKTIMYDAEDENPFAELVYTYNGFSTNKWKLVVDDSEVNAEDPMNVDIYVYPMFDKDSGVEAVKPKLGTSCFTYARGGEILTSARSILTGDDVIVAYFAPAEETPAFFVRNGEEIRRDNAFYPYYSALCEQGGDAGTVFVPVYLDKNAAWCANPEAEAVIKVPESAVKFVPGVSYMQGHSVEILWPDGGRAATDFVPHGASLVPVLYSVEETEDTTTITVWGNFPDDLEEDIKGMLPHGGYIGENFYLFSEYSDERISEIGDFPDMTVTEDTEYRLYGSRLSYLDRDGKWREITLGGIPKGTNVRYVLCEAGDEAAAIDRAIEGTDIAAPGEEELKNARRNGYIYLEGEGDEPETLVAVLIYANEEIVWYRNGERVPESELNKSDAIVEAYSGIADEITYTLTERGENEAERLKVSVKLKHFGVIEWHEGI